MTLQYNENECIQKKATTVVKTVENCMFILEGGWEESEVGRSSGFGSGKKTRNVLRVGYYPALYPEYLYAYSVSYGQGRAHKGPSKSGISRSKFDGT
jgi:hypothetical protein